MSDFVIDQCRNHYQRVRVIETNGEKIEAFVSSYFKLEDPDDFPEKLYEEFCEGVKLNMDFIGYGYFSIHTHDEYDLSRYKENISPVYACFSAGDWYLSYHFDAEGKLVLTDCQICGETPSNIDKDNKRYSIPFVEHKKLSDEDGNPFLVCFRGNGHIPIATPIHGTNWKRWFRWESRYQQRLAAELIRNGHKMDEELYSILNLPCCEFLSSTVYDQVYEIAKKYNVDIGNLPDFPRRPAPQVKQSNMEAWC